MTHSSLITANGVRVLCILATAAKQRAHPAVSYLLVRVCMRKFRKDTFMIVAPSLFGLNHQKFALTIRGNKRMLAPELFMLFF
jgi:hypothetical protein